jgi:hypothetical protein
LFKKATCSGWSLILYGTKDNPYKQVNKHRVRNQKQAHTTQRTREEIDSSLNSSSAKSHLNSITIKIYFVMNILHFIIYVFF